MIKSFNCAETEKLFERQFSLKFPQDIQRTALRKLRMLNRAININDLWIPRANRLEKLIGKRKRQYSIRINNQWRICFVWQDNDAINVEIIDYH
ncbi:MAG: type II toxin-antitoxin system RelE/ParE family toxin [Cytophagia bacterium]|nr:type II toxin-antitoxin system RelE/ParE family toxin [Cytophagia bacterium]